MGRARTGRRHGQPRAVVGRPAGSKWRVVECLLLHGMAVERQGHLARTCLWGEACAGRHQGVAALLLRCARGALSAGVDSAHGRKALEAAAKWGV